MNLGALFLVLAIIAFGCLAFAVAPNVPWLAIGLILLCLGLLLNGVGIPMRTGG